MLLIRYIPEICISGIKNSLERRVVMNDIQKFTIELIRYEIFNIPIDSNLVAMADDEMIEAVYDFAIKIDMGYIVASALSKLNLLADEAKSAFFSEQLATVYRYEALKYDLESISNLFCLPCKFLFTG